MIKLIMKSIMFIFLAVGGLYAINTEEQEINWDVNLKSISDIEVFVNNQS